MRILRLQVQISVFRNAKIHRAAAQIQLQLTDIFPGAESFHIALGNLIFVNEFNIAFVPVPLAVIDGIICAVAQLIYHTHIFLGKRRRGASVPRPETPVPPGARVQMNLPSGDVLHHLLHGSPSRHSASHESQQ